MIPRLGPMEPVLGRLKPLESMEPLRWLEPLDAMEPLEAMVPLGPIEPLFDPVRCNHRVQWNR